MRELKYRINYERLVETVDGFPGILGEFRTAFKGVRDAVREKMDEDEGVLIHGDLWSGK